MRKNQSGLLTSGRLGVFSTAYEERDIQKRTRSFAVKVLKFVRLVPRDIAGQVVARQIARSGTSVGANVEEAQGAHSNAEFSRRMGIARSEARETLYWLRLIDESGMVPRDQLSELMGEAQELVRILTANMKKVKNRVQ